MKADAPRIWSLPAIPVTYFGAVLGIGGLGSGWRAAHRVWGLSPIVGEVLSLTAFGVWLVCGVLFAAAFARGRETTRGDFRDPTRTAFSALLPMSTMIAALALRPYELEVSGGIAIAGLAAQVAIGAWATGISWRGGRAIESVTPILLLPTVGGFFVAAITAAQFVDPSLGLLFFGAGSIAWVVTESVILHRLASLALPPPLRATLGIHLTPPALACVAYLALDDRPPDRFAQMLFGYALLQGLVMLRLVPWLRRQTFSHRAWAYTFGISALPLAALRFVELGQTGPIAMLAPPLFVGANLAVGWIALRSVALGVAAFAGRAKS